ncbi:MAG: BBP7 family outer membrane beta-barrel protein [Planctomycetales bacterium]|nr:BBP7 family outer membrane beta-barrel protein [Planctomycetales bacterium]
MPSTRLVVHAVSVGLLCLTAQTLCAQTAPMRTYYQPSYPPGSLYPAQPNYAQPTQSGPGQYIQPAFAQPGYPQARTPPAPGYPLAGPMGDFYRPAPAHPPQTAATYSPLVANQYMQQGQAPQPAMSAPQPGQMVYGDGQAPAGDYGQVADGYVQEALTHPQPEAAVLSPWGANSGSGCGPGTSCYYPSCGDGTCDGEVGWNGKVRAALGSYRGVQNGCGPRPTPWFASAYGLFLERSTGQPHMLSEDLGSGYGILSTYNADFDFEPGVEVRFGRRFGSCWAIEATYWTLFEAEAEALIISPNYPGGMGSRLDLSSLSILQGGLGATVQSYYDGAYAHRLRRSFEVTNVEINLLHFPVMGSPCGGCNACGSCDGECGMPCSLPSRTTLSWNLGARYLRLDDYLQFATDYVDATFGDPTDEVFYDIDVENHLIGTQAGGHLFYCLSPRFSIYSDVNVGLYGNRINKLERIYNWEGYAYANTGNYVGQDYNLRTDKGAISVVGELRLGSHLQVTKTWRGTFAYRLMGVTGVALAEDQLSHAPADYFTAGQIKEQGSLLLHGFMFGLEHRF